MAQTLAEQLTIVIPAKNEAAALTTLLPSLRQHYPDCTIIVVNDGSTDQTEALCRANAIEVVSHPYSKGNGAAIKSGLRAATSDYILCMDADNQHRVEDIAALIAKRAQGYEMVVGARVDKKSQASTARLVANGFYNRFASWVSGHTIVDLTSGFRLMERRKALEFIHLLPNGFSYPTTITMAFFRAGYSVGYVPITTNPRIGKSHIRLWRDGARFLLIIFKIGTLFSPMKLFLPVSLALFLTASGYYLHTYLTISRFTNMSALLYMTSVIIFMLGLVSEQITALLYKDNSQRQQS
ncbi:glycosyltransferase family 2 protein [Ectothiorhodospiraceae bacterium BW-2]|nr:glycosyltransferase family 2 protein [Ectothiorhodospiraceae bacterium BW-2]